MFPCTCPRAFRFSRIIELDTPVCRRCAVRRGSSGRRGTGRSIGRRPAGRPAGRSPRCRPPCGFRCSRQASSIASEELGLHQRFAAGKGHAAARVVVKNTVPRDFEHHVGDRHATADQLPGLGRAGRRARPASQAVGPIDRRGPRGGVAVCRRQRTGRLGIRRSPSTVGASTRSLGLRFHALGIMAPPTSQRTALQEHGRPDPRPVLDRILLDIEYQTADHVSRAEDGSIVIFTITIHNNRGSSNREGDFRESLFSPAACGRSTPGTSTGAKHDT